MPAIAAVQMHKAAPPPIPEALSASDLSMDRGKIAIKTADTCLP
jgi:hypothetical protein